MRSTLVTALPGIDSNERVSPLSLNVAGRACLLIYMRGVEYATRAAIILSQTKAILRLLANSPDDSR